MEYTITQSFIKNNPRYKSPQKKAKKSYMQHSTGAPGAKASRFIKSWNSGTEIKRTLGYSNGNICNCCRGKQKTAYGYKWQYAELLGG